MCFLYQMPCRLNLLEVLFILQTGEVSPPSIPSPLDVTAYLKTIPILVDFWYLAFPNDCVNNTNRTHTHHSQHTFQEMNRHI